MFFRFLCVGGSGFIIDVAITYLLISLQTEPWLARIPAIFFAMLFTWLANRHFTYEFKNQRTIKEALSYASISIAVSIINYAIYIYLVYCGMLPVAAVTIATICQAILSYNLYRLIVFKKPDEDHDKYSNK
jgi:putative flippase GtrA